MNSFALISTTTHTTTLNNSAVQFCLPSSLCPKRSKVLSFAKKPRKFSVFASKDESMLDQWDQMELKFGRMIGEDPKLTLAKIMGRKSNPDISYMEIEKSFEKKKGKVVNDIEEVPFDVSKGKKSPNSLDGLNLIRPVPKKGVKFEVDNAPREREKKKQSEPVGKAVKNGKVSVPNVILRKPSMYNEDDVAEETARLRIKPNLTLQMGRAPQKERFTDMTLLKKPEPMKVKPNDEEEDSQSGDAKAGVVDETVDGKKVSVAKGSYTDLSLLEKPNATVEQEEHINDHSGPAIADISSEALANASTDLLEGAESDGDQLLETNEEGSGKKNDSVNGLQSSNTQSTGKISDSNRLSKKMEPKPGISVEVALLGKPQRLDQPLKATTNISRENTVPVTPEGFGNAVTLENFLTTPPVKEHEDNDWTRAEYLVKTGNRVEVELISSSTRGFVVSFGSLIGFLPYRNLFTKWKFLAFESWLRRKGLDPYTYRQTLGIIGSSEATIKLDSPDSRLDLQIDDKLDKEISPDMKLEELLCIYDKEKLKFLSSFVGQRIKVSVILADRRSRKLVFSTKPKENEELLGKKRSLMAKLSVGDVVKCCVKKITYFGIFVEVEGVAALIHQREVSWDATLDPASYFKIGQIIEAKVHQLDFSLERIFLSLKEITPDPLMEALEAVVGGHDALDGRLEAAEADTEWAEVESLIQELQQFEGIQSVSKGRYFLSPGLAPTFQVYMAAMFEDQYKLLARSGNQVQELMVQTSLGKEEMKSVILTCTNRVV